MKLPPGIDIDQIARVAEAAREAFDSNIAAGERLRQQAIEAAQKATDAFRFVPPEVTSMATQVRAVMEKLHETFRAGLDFVSPLAEQAQKLKEELDRLPAKVRDGLEVLGRHGWYPDEEGMTFPEIYPFVEALAHGDAEDAHERLCQHFEVRMDAILEAVVANFPHRERVIRAAFAAHQRGEYELSVPVLLAQTDGICKELMGVQLCGRRNGRLRTATEVESWKQSDLSRATLHPLLVVLPIAFNEDERKGVDGILNRHAVLHGEDVTYGNRRNGCRAISLLGYVASTLRDREPEGDAT